MAKKKKHKNDVKTDLPIIMDYGIGSISVYDPADIMPYNEPPISEQIRFKKLGKEMKSEFKWLVSSVVIEYWQENRQIPFGEEMSKLRTRLLRMFAEEYSILLKDDTELKNYLLTLAITTINKHLKSENKKRVSNVIVKTCSDSLFSIGQKNCQLFVAKLRNFLDSHNRMVLY